MTSGREQYWSIKAKKINIQSPLIMGILNVTPDSFSDGGKYNDSDKAIKQAQLLKIAGADIIDIGGESTRPGAQSITAEDELDRVIPIISEISSLEDILISIDTQKSIIAREALNHGAHIVNDISAGTYDSGMFKLIADSQAGYVMMHMQGRPETMQKSPSYDNIILEIKEFFAGRIEAASQAGIIPDQITLDPGIGFGKTLRDNLELLANLETLHSFNRPIVLGASRKSYIGMIDESEATDRLGGSLATVISSYLQGVQIYRVHDVRETRQALDIFSAIQKHSG